MTEQPPRRPMIETYVEPPPAPPAVLLSALPFLVFVACAEVAAWASCYIEVVWTDTRRRARAVMLFASLAAVVVPLLLQRHLRPRRFP